MAGGDDDAVGSVVALAAVEHDDRAAERRGRHPAVAGVDDDADAVADEHLDGGLVGGCRERMRVAADEQRPVDAVCGSVLADRLSDRRDVVVIESPIER